MAQRPQQQQQQQQQQQRGPPRMSMMVLDLDDAAIMGAELAHDSVDLDHVALASGLTVAELRDDCTPLHGVLAQCAQLCLRPAAAVALAASARDADYRRERDDPAHTLRAVAALQAALAREAARAHSIQCVHLAQALLASRHAQLHLKSLQKEYCPARNDSARELLRQETMFVFKLKMIVNRFLMPLEASTETPKPIITVAELRTIFGPIRDMVLLHEEILGTFRTIMSHWPNVRGFGGAVIGLAPKLAVYGTYVRNCPAAVQMCSNLRKTNARFAAFVDGAERNLPPMLAGVELADLLQCPLNQISVYEVVLQRMLDGTDALQHSASELNSLTNAVMVIHHLHTVVQVSFDLSHKRLRAVQIEALLGGLRECPGDEHRGFIGDWPVTVVPRQKNLTKKVHARHLFLFTDCLVLAKAKLLTPAAAAAAAAATSTTVAAVASSSSSSSSSSSPAAAAAAAASMHMFKVKDVLRVDQLAVRDDRPGSSPSTTPPLSPLSTPPSGSMSPVHLRQSGDSASSSAASGGASGGGGAECAFTLTAPHFAGVVRAASAGDKAAIVAHLATLQQQGGRGDGTQVFGADLPTLLLREQRLNTVPLAVEMLCDYIRSDIDAEGLFRVAPGMQEAKQLREYFDRGEHVRDPARLRTFSVHCAANVLKMFYREMPEPLVPFALYDFVVMVESQDAPDAAKARKLMSRLRTIPVYHRVLLHYTLTFFREVAQHAARNMMTETNIAIVFAANIIRPKTESVESILAMPRVSAAFETILCNDGLWNQLLDS